MHADPELVELLRADLANRPNIVEVKMFGGPSFRLNGHVCYGVFKEWLVARVGEKAAKELIQEPGCALMDITGKPMKAWVMVDRERWEDRATRDRVVDQSCAFVATLPPK